MQLQDLFIIKISDGKFGFERLGRFWFYTIKEHPTNAYEPFRAAISNELIGAVTDELHDTIGELEK